MNSLTGRAPPAFLALVAVAAAVALAGCTSSGAVSTRNFALEPQSVGWNVGETAWFTLTLSASTFSKEPAYEIDRDFAIEEIEFDEKGVGFGGDYRTRKSTEVGLHLWRDGHEVTKARLDSTNSTIDLSLVVPESLRDTEYTLDLRLFKVGWVSSEAFRVNVP